MKKLLPLSALLLCAGTASAQYGLGTNAVSPATLFELKSNTKGFLPPRMLYSERIALNGGAPVDGTMVFQTDNNGSFPAGLYVYSATAGAWAPASGASGGGSSWALTGNAGTVDGTSFVGTTDDVPLNVRVANQKAGRIEANATMGNTAYGYQSQNAAESGATANTSVGAGSLKNVTTGDFNTAVGTEAGGLATTASHGTYLGYQTRGIGINLQYVTAIGSQAYVTVSNGMALGTIDVGTSAKNSAVGPTNMNSSFVGINVSDPTQRIDFRNGHIRNRQDLLPSVSVLVQNGIINATVAVGSSDVRGRIQVNGTGSSSSDFTNIRVNFQYTATNAPVVTVTAANAAASRYDYYVTSDANGFNIFFSPTNIGTNPQFNYMVIE